ncbi:CatB-related O-acetyltransferase [Victivallis vadensis]|uniref:CatB-related O-acetyltransferase n=1 Tax=Victivallis vadensis TaxID=172901 RepID=UPI0023F73873|nr:CatB-related O-acetyltransferase [Victivallis vadensis]
MDKHWSRVEYLHETHRNPNIILKGTHSYYSDAWSGCFEEAVVRYLYGDAYSVSHYESRWEPDKLRIGDYVCIGAEAVILMGGNNTHRMDWFSCYPFADRIIESYESRGDTVIGDGVWIGMRAMLMPGVKIGEGAVIGAGAIVTRDVEPYCVVGGNPARLIRRRFPEAVVERLLRLKLYELPEAVFGQIRRELCSDDIGALERVISSAGL